MSVLRYYLLNLTFYLNFTGLSTDIPFLSQDPIQDNTLHLAMALLKTENETVRQSTVKN